MLILTIVMITVSLTSWFFLASEDYKYRINILRGKDNKLLPAPRDFYAMCQEARELAQIEKELDKELGIDNTQYCSSEGWEKGSLGVEGWMEELEEKASPRKRRR